MNCIFCKIINGELPSYKVYEDEYVLAFLNINPESNSHTLVIPKKHITDIMDMDNDTFIHIIDASRKVKKLLEDKLHIDGLTLVQNNGDVQEVKHFHMHLKPFYNNEKKLELEEVYNILTK